MVKAAQVKALEKMKGQTHLLHHRAKTPSVSRTYER
jgi:hypothetical protein